MGWLRMGGYLGEKQAAALAGLAPTNRDPKYGGHRSSKGGRPWLRNCFIKLLWLPRTPATQSLRQAPEGAQAGSRRRCPETHYYRKCNARSKYAM